MAHRSTCQCAKCYYGNRLFWLCMAIVTAALLAYGLYNSVTAW